MKHEKFVKFIEDISVDGNEYLGESIMEAYGLCFYGVSLRNEADKLLESISGNKALCEALGEETLGEGGVIEKIRKWPRKKIMGLLLGALITMTAAKGMAADNPQVIDGARDRVIEQLGGDGDGDDEAVDKMVKGAVKKYGDKIEKKAAEKGHIPTDGDHKIADANSVNELYQDAKQYVIKEINKGEKGEETEAQLRELAKKLLSSDDETKQAMGKALNKAISDVHKEVFAEDDSRRAKSFVEKHLKNGKTIDQLRDIAEKFLSDDNEDSQRVGKAVLTELEHRERFDEKMDRELIENEKLVDAGMSAKDVGAFRLATVKNIESGTYTFNGVMVNSNVLSDTEKVKQITQRAYKILSKS